MIKFSKKKIAFSLVVIVFASVAGFMLFDYYRWNKVVKAVGGFPWQDGGIITFYNPSCAMVMGKCTCQSLPFTCDGFCVGHSMIAYNGQRNGPSIMCVPQGFVYQGGGATPRIGASIIAGGITNMGAMIKVIGISQ